MVAQCEHSSFFIVRHKDNLQVAITDEGTFERDLLVNLEEIRKKIINQIIKDFLRGCDSNLGIRETGKNLT
jgi:hypothetical protein